MKKGLLCCLVACWVLAGSQARAADKDFTSKFNVAADEWTNTGGNPFFKLEPGYTLVLEGKEARLIITVLNETLKVDGVETRVVEERETVNGQLGEVSRNYFATSKTTGDV